MAKAKSHVPQGLPTAITQLVVKDAHAVIDFAARAFGADRGHTMPGPDGKGVMHGMFVVGGTPIFVSDIGGFAQPTSANVFIYVPDVDQAYARALQAGAKSLAPVADMFWGDRWCMVMDPQGTIWQVATHVEDLSPEEMQRRAPR